MQEYNKISILIIVRTLDVGGSVIVMKNIIDNLSKSKINVDLVCFRSDKITLYNEFNVKVNNIYFLHEEDKSIIFLIVKLFNIIRKGKYYFIITNGEKESILSELCSFFLRSKTVNFLHGITIKRNFIKKHTYKFFRNLQKNKVVVGHSLKERLVKLGYKNNMLVIPNGIPISTEKIEKQNESFNFFHVGRFCDEKDQLTTIKAFAIFLKKIPYNQKNNYKLFLIGRGEESYLIKFNELIELLDIKENVKIESSSNFWSDYGTQISCLIQSSYSEGLPIIVLEAMNNLIPIIASNISAHSELIKDNINGLLFKVGDADKLGHKMLQVVSYPKRIEELTNAAFSYVCVNHDIKKQTFLFEKYLYSIVSKN